MSIGRDDYKSQLEVDFRNASAHDTCRRHKAPDFHFPIASSCPEQSAKTLVKGPSPFFLGPRRRHLYCARRPYDRYPARVSRIPRVVITSSYHRQFFLAADATGIEPGKCDRDDTVRWQRARIYHRVQYQFTLSLKNESIYERRERRENGFLVSFLLLLFVITARVTDLIFCGMSHTL